MLTLIRRFQKEVLIVVTAIIVVAFAFLYSDFDFAKGTLGTESCVIEIGGRCYRAEEAQKIARFQSLAFGLGMSEFADTLRGDRLDMDPTDFVLSLLVLRKEAERLGIEPSADEIKEAVPKLPIFQQMPWADDSIMRNILGSQGLDEGDLAQLMKDYLSFSKLQELIGAGVEAVPTQVDTTYLERNQRYTAYLIPFDRTDYLDTAEISDEEIKEYFEERNGSGTTEAPVNEAPANLEFAENPDAIPAPDATSVKDPGLEEILTAPMRGFDYVKFMPEELGEEATAEEKTKSEVNFAKAVNRVYAELADEEADFVEVAKGFVDGSDTDVKMTLGKLEPFKQDEAPEEYTDINGLLEALFSGALMTGGVTTPLSGGEDGSYYVFRFSDAVEPRPMTLEEAKPLIVKALTAKKSNQLASEAAEAAATKLKEALESGSSILDAASANNLNLVDLPNFSMMEPPGDQDDPGLILQSVSGTQAGELSSVTERPGGKGYFITYVDKIEVYKDENKEAAKRSLAAEAALQERTLLFRGWLNQRRVASGARRNNSILNYPSRM